MVPKKNILLFPLLSTMLGLFLALAALEIVFRILPTSDFAEQHPVNAQSPVKHFVPNRTLLWSNHFNFSMTNEIHVNNYGFVNNQVYTTEDDRPLLAVIGDSYVEAFMVPYKETLHGRLASTLENNGRIYSFGTSGSALSQYLAYANYVRTEFRPDGMIFIVISNDFDESLCKYKSSPTLHCFQEDLEDNLVLIRIDWKPNPIAKFLGHSALYRYITLNLKIRPEHVFQRIKSYLFTNEVEYVQNVKAQARPEKEQDSYQAIDEFLKLVPNYSGLPRSKILFVTDAIRSSIYDPTNLEKDRASYAYKMMEYFITKAREGGYELVNMREVFDKHYQKHQKKFEFPSDNHWNGIGHKVVAESISKTQLFNNTFATGQRYGSDHPSRKTHKNDR